MFYSTLLLVSIKIYSVRREKIFGYNDLKIDLYYSAGWLRTYINVSFKEKIDPSVIGLPVSIKASNSFSMNDQYLIHLWHLQADNVIEILSKFLEHDYFENIDLFVNSLKEEPKFKPSGSLIDSISVTGIFEWLIEVILVSIQNWLVRSIVVFQKMNVRPLMKFITCMSQTQIVIFSRDIINVYNDFSSGTSMVLVLLMWTMTGGIIL